VTKNRDHRRGHRRRGLATLVVNKMRGTINALAIKAPGFGDRRRPSPGYRHLTAAR
jgi:hypothetical protein